MQGTEAEPMRNTILSTPTCWCNATHCTTKYTLHKQYIYTTYTLRTECVVDGVGPDGRGHAHAAQHRGVRVDLWEVCGQKSGDKF